MVGFGKPTGLNKATRFNSVSTAFNTAYGFNGTTAGFNPASQTDLLVWLKPEAGVTTSGGNLTSWANQGNGGSSYNATANASPTWSSTLLYGATSGVVLNGTSQYLTLASNLVLTGDFRIILMGYQMGINSSIVGHSSTTGRLGYTAYNASSITVDGGSPVTFTGWPGGSNIHCPMNGHEVVLTYERVGSTVSRYVNGILDVQATASGTITLNQIGKSATGFYGGSINEIMIFNSSASSRLVNEDYLRQKYQCGLYTWVAELSSRSRGDGAASVTPNTSVAAYCMTQAKADGLKGWIVYESGISGKALVGGDSDASSTSGTQGIDKKTYYTKKSKPLLVCTDAGSNDISFGAPNTSTVLSRLNTYVTNRKNSGTYRNIIISTYASGGNSTVYANGQPINQGIRDGMAPGGQFKLAGADAYTDIAAISGFSADGDYLNNSADQPAAGPNSRYQTDRIHSTAYGYSLITPSVYAVVKPYMQAAMAS